MSLAGLAAIIAATGGFSGLAALITAMSSRRRSPADHHQQAPEHDPSRARWCLLLGTVAVLLAGGLVSLVGTTQLALDRPPIVLLEWGVVASAALAVPIGVTALNYSIRRRQPHLTLFAGSGLVAALGAVLATAIAGTG